MPSLTLSVTDRQDMFGAGLAKRLKKFEDAELQARRAAAALATRTTRAGFHYHRDLAPPRAGRSSTGGHMTDFLEWKLTRDGGVGFDLAAADRGAPHWIIQEVGTGKRATMRVGGTTNAPGRPAAGATKVRTVPSQVGRRLRGGLVFASGGQYSPTGSGHREQIFWASQVKGVPRGAPSIVIKREIQGQHFVQKGGQSGFRQYRSSVLAAARQAFSQAGKP